MAASRVLVAEKRQLWLLDDHKVRIRWDPKANSPEQRYSRPRLYSFLPVPGQRAKRRIFTIIRFQKPCLAPLAASLVCDKKPI